MVSDVRRCKLEPMWLRALVRTRACYVPSPGKKNSQKNAVLGRPVLRLIEPCVLVLGGFSGRGEAEPQGPRVLVLDPGSGLAVRTWSPPLTPQHGAE